MQRFPRRWDKITCVNYLQRKIILNCIAYYELNTNRLTDKQYDELSRQLVEMHKDLDINDTQYGYVFYDFDGSTGFDLFHRLNKDDQQYLMNIAQIGLGDVKAKTNIVKKRGRLI